MVTTPKTLRAVEVALVAHKGQKRKGKDVPFAVHPICVGLVLASLGESEEVIIAGILHDTLEDTTLSRNDILTKFGEKVVDIVEAVTEKDKTLAWRERKLNALGEVSKMSKQALLVKTADALCNLSDLVEDYTKIGEGVFKRFSSSKEEQLARYGSLVKALEKAWRDNPLLDDLQNVLHELRHITRNE